MRAANFGWYYPPGAEHDPRAPWNAPDDDLDDDCEPDDPREDPHYDY